MTEDIEKWIRKENLIQEGDAVIVGVSGGADSVCLLKVLLMLQERLHFSLHAVHVEHGIRGDESRQDAEFVERLCREWGVPCRVFLRDVPQFAKTKGIGLEEAARILRYDCYREAAEALWSEAIGKVSGPQNIKVALAHHADDNAETVLFQMVRGSGIRGLSGIRPKRELTEHAWIIRPLLAVTRKEIEAFLREEGQTFCIDRTNQDTDYSRNRIRHEVMPHLTRINSQAVAHVAKSAEYLREAADYLESQAAELSRNLCRWTEGECQISKEVFEQHPAVLQRMLVLSVLGRVAGSQKDIGNVHVEAVLNLAKMQVGKSVSLPYRMKVERIYEGIRVFTERDGSQSVYEDEQPLYEVTAEMLTAAERGEQILISLPDGEILLRVMDFTGKIQEIQKKKYTKWIDYDKIKCGLQIRKRASGDYLIIDDSGHHKKLKEYLIEEKIPCSRREDIWLAADGARIVWVMGGRIGADCKIRENTKKVLEIHITGGQY